MRQEAEPPRDIAIGRLADQQHGVVTTRQLQASGLSDAAISRRVGAGRLRRLHRGVYAVGHVALSREGRWMAAVLAVPGGVLTGAAAAELWGFARFPATRIDVLARGNPHPRAGVDVHRTRSLPSSDVRQRRGIPTTSVEPTLLELARTTDPEPLAQMMYQAARIRLLDIDRVRDVVGRSSGRAEVAVLEQAVVLHESGSAGARSRSERRLAARLRRATSRRFRLNVVVRTIDDHIEVDILFERERLVVELDGPHHALPAQRRRDRERDAALREVGAT